MKIKVADLEPNPFRKIKEYPIDRDKVEALKTSIKEKTFWDNILVRPHPNKEGKYQLAYGHHRYICLVELGIKEIDVPIRELEDALLLQIMAEENLNWSTSTAVMTQTIFVAKEFLDAELQKYKNWDTSAEIIKGLFDNQKSYETSKGMGVGRNTLIKFLGGNWTGYKVEVSLNIIKDKDLDESVKEIPTIGQARAFHESVRKYKTPKIAQKKIVNVIVKEGVGKRDIPRLVRQHIPKDQQQENTEMIQLQTLIENIDSHSRTLLNLIMKLRQQMRTLGIQEVKGAKVWLAKSSLNRLSNELEKLKERNSDETNS